MSHDVGVRAGAYFAELCDAAGLEESVTGVAPDEAFIEYLFKRLSRLYSLRKQLLRLEDELELVLVGAGRGTTDPPGRSMGDMWLALDEISRLVDELKRRRRQDDESGD